MCAAHNHRNHPVGPTVLRLSFGILMQQSVDEHEQNIGTLNPYSPRPGTPAAKMPQVDGRAIKARAARLRGAGEARVAAHLAEQQGRRHAVLMENPRMGRTEQFTEVAFDSDRREGAIVSATVTGHTGTQLTAV